MPALKEWWENLQARERIYVISGASAVVLMLFYVMALDPLFSNARKLNKLIPKKQVELQWMQQAALQINQLSHSRPKSNTRNRSLLSVLDQRVNATGLKSAIQRMEPEGRTEVKIWFKNSPFDLLISMLAQLEQDDGIIVSSFSITPTDGTGVVDGRTTLTRGGS